MRQVIETAFIALLAGVTFVSSRSLAETARRPLPVWVSKEIARLRETQSRDEIEEATYNGGRVFEFISGERFDTGDEHSLFTEGGKKLCQFGGFVGHVTSGSCDIRKIVFVRTLYPPNPG